MRSILRHARRNFPLLAVTALLMAGAGCVGAARETAAQLSEDALAPIDVPSEAYGQVPDAVPGPAAFDLRRPDGFGG